MGTLLFSPEWMKAYAELWNSTEATRDGLKNLSMVIDWRLAEDESRVGQIEVVEGEVVRAGAPAANTKPDYVLTADTETWRRLGTGELAAAKALIGRKVKFRGRMSVAMAHLKSFEAGMRFFGKIEETHGPCE